MKKSVAYLVVPQCLRFIKDLAVIHGKHPWESCQHGTERKNGSPIGNTLKQGMNSYHRNTGMTSRTTYGYSRRFFVERPGEMAA